MSLGVEHAIAETGKDWQWRPLLGAGPLKFKLCYVSVWFEYVSCVGRREIEFIRGFIRIEKCIISNKENMKL